MRGCYKTSLTGLRVRHRCNSDVEKEKFCLKCNVRFLNYYWNGVNVIKLAPILLHGTKLYLIVPAIAASIDNKFKFSKLN